MDDRVDGMPGSLSLVCGRMCPLLTVRMKVESIKPKVRRERGQRSKSKQAYNKQQGFAGARAPGELLISVTDLE